MVLDPFLEDNVLSIETLVGEGLCQALLFGYDKEGVRVLGARSLKDLNYEGVVKWVFFQMLFNLV